MLFFTLMLASFNDVKGLFLFFFYSVDASLQHFA